MKYPFLIFTSAGDEANIHQWIKVKKFDLFISYYGNSKNKYRNLADHYIMRKGSKFQNLYFLYRNNPKIFEKYTHVWVMDDDIRISSKLINRMFEISRKYDLWISQPTFEVGKSKISHKITIKEPFVFMKYVNFIEVCLPLFRTDKLIEFLKVYDGMLVGWGIDWWFMEVLKPPKDKAAIIDYYSCSNPFEYYLKEKRKIDILQPESVRKMEWEKTKKENNLFFLEIVETYRKRYNFMSILKSSTCEIRSSFIYFLSIRMGLYKSVRWLDKKFSKKEKIAKKGFMKNLLHTIIYKILYRMIRSVLIRFTVNTPFG